MLSIRAREKLREAAALFQNGLLTRAQQLCEAALEIEPASEEALHLLGLIAAQSGDRQRAAELMGRAIGINPSNPSLHYNRGVALQGLARLDEALGCYDQALLLRPDYAQAHNNRGVLLLQLARPDEALANFAKALALMPDMEHLFGQYLHTKMVMCDWRSLAENIDRLANSIVQSKIIATPFVALSLLDDPALHKAAAKNWIRAKHPAAAWRRQFRRREPGEKLRLGYYSADFHDHATAHLIAEMLEELDRERFELFGFSFGPDAEDSMRKRVSSTFSQFINVKEENDRQVADMSMDLGIDIAIDLKGLTAGARPGVFAERCAPIQVMFLGYPGTTGADYIDYIIADKIVMPRENEAFFAEKVVYLPHSYQPNDSKRMISDRIFTRTEFGLPEAGLVFCCFNASYKILPATFDGWMRILEAAPGSVLWLLANNSAATNNLRAEAEARGIDGRRLIFAARAPLEEHLGRQKLADLFLDTQPYGAHTTASDALWGGLPVLTLRGRSFASRVAASLLLALELPELVTDTQQDYEAKAIELAKTPTKLVDLRRKLHEKKTTSPLFKGKLFAKHIEAAFDAMYARYRAGLVPAAIEVHP